MAAELHIQGTWPAPIRISRSWALAEARRWNDDAPEAFLRLVRGGASFLRDTSARLVDLAGAEILSPALFKTSSRVWERSGFQPGFVLDVMERSLKEPVVEPGGFVTVSAKADLPALADVDRAAFEPFWRMNPAGLSEALRSTRSSAALTVAVGAELVGYAIVGAQWSSAYLQRLAVRPSAAGQGLGTELVRAAVAWGMRNGLATMILNVKPENLPAVSLYQKEGFTRASTSACVYRYEAA